MGLLGIYYFLGQGHVGVTRHLRDVTTRGTEGWEGRGDSEVCGFCSGEAVFSYRVKKIVEIFLI